MAGRGYGQVLTSIWSDPEFVVLPRTAQCTYLMFVSHPDLNYAGILPLTERRWARTCAETTRSDIEADVKVLADARFVVIDEDTEELLVRSFVRNDRLWTQPRMLGVAAREALDVKSSILRRTLAEEFARIELTADSENRPTTRDLLRETKEALFGGPEPPPEPGAAAWPEPTPAEGLGQGTRAYERGRDARHLAPSTCHLAPSTKSGSVGNSRLRENFQDRQAELCGQGHSLPAHQRVEGYAKRCTYRPAAAVLAALGPQVDELLANDWPAELVDRCLDAWGAKGLDARKFSSVAHEVANSGGPAGARPRRSTADTEIARLQSLKTGTDGPSLRALPGGES